MYIFLNKIQNNRMHFICSKKKKKKKECHLQRSFDVVFMFLNTTLLKRIENNFNCIHLQYFMSLMNTMCENNRNENILHEYTSNEIYSSNYLYVSIIPKRISMSY